MFSRFFIERPRFAMVISIVLTLAGAIAVFSLPISLYPEITPPEVVVSATYPGASAEVIAKTVGIPLEDTNTTYKLSAPVSATTLSDKST